MDTTRLPGQVLDCSSRLERIFLSSSGSGTRHLSRQGNGLHQNLTATNGDDLDSRSRLEQVYLASPRAQELYSKSTSMKTFDDVVKMAEEHNKSSSHSSTSVKTFDDVVKMAEEHDKSSSHSSSFLSLLPDHSLTSAKPKMFTAFLKDKEFEVSPFKPSVNDSTIKQKVSMVLSRLEDGVDSINESSTVPATVNGKEIHLSVESDSDEEIDAVTEDEDKQVAASKNGHKDHDSDGGHDAENDDNDAVNVDAKGDNFEESNADEENNNMLTSKTPDQSMEQRLNYSTEFPEGQQQDASKTHCLKLWSIKAVKTRTHMGIIVEGQRSEDPAGELWHSTAIISRIGPRCVQTKSGSQYKLIGPVNDRLTLQQGFSPQFVKSFKNGFPPNWLSLVADHFNSQSSSESDNETQGVEQPEKKDKKHPKQAKHSTSASPLAESTNARKRKFMVIQPLSSALKTPENRQLPEEVEVKTTRSGRMVKPPLAWWRGQRILTDRHHNLEGIDPGGEEYTARSSLYNVEIKLPIKINVTSPFEEIRTATDRKGRRRKRKATKITMSSKKSQPKASALQQETSSPRKSTSTGSPQQVLNSSTKSVSTGNLQQEINTRSPQQVINSPTKFPNTRNAQQEVSSANQSLDVEDSTETINSPKESPIRGNSQRQINSSRKSTVEESLQNELSSPKQSTNRGNSGKEIYFPVQTSTGQEATLLTETGNYIKLRSTGKSLQEINERTSACKSPSTGIPRHIPGQKNGKASGVAAKSSSNSTQANEHSDEPRAATLSYASGRSNSNSSGSETENEKLKKKLFFSPQKSPNKTERLQAVSEKDQLDDEENRADDSGIKQTGDKNNKVTRDAVQTRSSRRKTEDVVTVENKLQNNDASLGDEDKKAADDNRIKQKGDKQSKDTRDLVQRRSSRRKTEDVATAEIELQNKDASLGKKTTMDLVAKGNVQNSERRKKFKDVYTDSDNEVGDQLPAANVPSPPKRVLRSRHKNIKNKQTISDVDSEDGTKKSLKDSQASSCDDGSDSSAHSRRRSKARGRPKNVEKRILYERVRALVKETASTQSSGEDSEGTYPKVSTKQTHSKAPKVVRANPTPQHQLETDNRPVTGSRIRREKSDVVINRVPDKKQASKVSKQTGNKVNNSEQNEMSEGTPWNDEEIQRLNEALFTIPGNTPMFWQKVSRKVASRTAQECQLKHQGEAFVSNKRASSVKQTSKNDPGIKVSVKAVSGGVGTIKRKREIRELLEEQDVGYEDDIFDSTPFKRWKDVKLPYNLRSNSSYENNDDDDEDNDEECSETDHASTCKTPGSRTPSSRFRPLGPLSVSTTPNTEFVSPSLLQPVNRKDMDHYIYRMQQRKRTTQAPGKQKAKQMRTSTPKKPSSSRHFPAVVSSDIFEAHPASDDNDEDEKDYYFSDE